MTHAAGRKERPIPFSGPKVRAILEGRSTQTRLVIKGTFCFGSVPNQPLRIPGLKPLACPYGVPGDRLWVKETWAPGDRWVKIGYECDPPEYVWYRATDELLGPNHRFPENDDAPLARPAKWKSEMFMPCILSRITLEITAVRVERLQDITESDAKAEGASGHCACCAESREETAGIYPYICKRRSCSPYSTNFSQLCDSLNAKRGYGWEKNPWVYVLDFKIIKSK